MKEIFTQNEVTWAAKMPLSNARSPVGFFTWNFWKMSGCWFRISGMGLGESERVLQQKCDLCWNPATCKIHHFLFKGKNCGEEGWTWGRFRPLNGSMGAGIYLEAKWPLFLKVTPPKTRHFPIKTKVIWVLGIPTFYQVLAYQRYWDSSQPSPMRCHQLQVLQDKSTKSKPFVSFYLHVWFIYGIFTHIYLLNYH